jgi:hypothetical protein
MAKPKLGSGKRFSNLVKTISKEKGIKNPMAVAASIGMKKYGKKGMANLAHYHSLKGKKMM